MSRDATAVYTYKGAPNALLSGVLKAIEQVNLTITHESVNDDSFSFEVSEKRKWLSINWPIKFKIESSFMNGASIVIIKASSTLTLYRQEISNQAKINEFLDLVKNFVPNINESNYSATDIERIPCPKCGEMIAKTAKLCHFCKTEF
jgi:hypothetical protein